jgi:transposase
VLRLIATPGGGVAAAGACHGRGIRALLAWARSAARDSRAVWAVEGTRHYGLGLACYLTSAGEQVSEIDNSRHVGKRRAAKSDAIDAVRAARELLARPHPAQMRADGDREALRLLMTGRDNAVASAKTASTRAGRHLGHRTGTAVRATPPPAPRAPGP